MKRKTIIRIINTMIILVGLFVIIGTVIHKNFTLQESKAISPTRIIIVLMILIIVFRFIVILLWY